MSDESTNERPADAGDDRIKDYTAERHKLLDGLTLAQIVAGMLSIRRPKRSDKTTEPNDESAGEPGA